MSNLNAILKLSTLCTVLDELPKHIKEIRELKSPEAHFVADFLQAVNEIWIEEIRNNIGGPEVDKITAMLKSRLN